MNWGEGTDPGSRLRTVTTEYLHELYAEIRLHKREKEAMREFLIRLGYDWDEFHDERFDHLPEMVGRRRVRLDQVAA